MTKISNPWNILLPGKSLDFYNVHWDWPTIAVNAAIVGAKRVDYLACRDKPNRWVADAIEEAKAKRPVMLVSPSHRAVQAWKECFTAWHKDEQPADIATVDWQDFDWVKKEVNPNPDKTVFFAILYAIEVGGTKDIHLHGCDMSGKGYHIDNIDCRPQKWEQRWAREIETMIKFFRAARERGIRINGLPQRLVYKYNLV